MSGAHDSVCRIDAFADFLRAGDARASTFHYRLGMQFPDSTFAALRIAPDDDGSASWGRLLWLAIVLTIAAVSAGLLAGG
ncbi:MAG: hypothetical protein ACXWUL_03120 [Caldimonas sp.]